MIFESLSAEPFAAAGLIAIGAGLFALGCLIAWLDGRRAGRVEGYRDGVGTCVLNYVIREVRYYSRDDLSEGRSVTMGRPIQ